MGHAWPAGAGGQDVNFVDARRVNYPEYLADFFFNNNLRVNRDPAPRVTSCAAAVASDRHTVTVTGAATDNGTVKSYRVALLGPTSIDEILPGGASFSKPYTTLVEGFYTGLVRATDDKDQPSEACNLARFVIGDPPLIAPPANVRPTGSTSSSITLTWDPSDGATGYNVFRNAAKVTATPIPIPPFTDTGLAANMTYNYSVSALGPGGESVPSAPPIPGKTQVSPCVAVRDNNFAHVRAGRAHDVAGFAFANGSNQNMGLDNLFFRTTLAQLSPGHYIIGDCPP